MLGPLPQGTSPTSRIVAPLVESGLVLDRYELVCMLGSGGMASVWLARQLGPHSFAQLVVVKTIAPEHAANEQFRKMLIDEASIAALLRHPNVARVLDLGEAKGILFMAMEWVPGEPLSRIFAALRTHRISCPARVIRRIVADVARGLHAAHELHGPSGKLGVVHRDVSPQNVMIDEHGVAKLIDFGIAKARGRIAAETEDGCIKGKIRFMPPEQALGLATIDRRADIWAAGALLYFLLEGHYPYDGPNDAEVLLRLASQAPFRPFVLTPPELRPIIERCLRYDPKERFPTAAELADELESEWGPTTGPASNSEVARFLREALPEVAEARSRLVRRALPSTFGDAEFPKPVGAPMVSVVAPRSGRPTFVAPSAEDADPPSSSVAVEPVQSFHARRAYAAFFSLTVVIVLAVWTSTIVGRRHQVATDPPVPTAAATALATPSAAAATTISVPPTAAPGPAPTQASTAQGPLPSPATQPVATGQRPAASARPRPGRSNTRPAAHRPPPPDPNEDDRIQ